MVSIKENTVSAKNQMINSSDLSFLGTEDADKKILIVGNSITRHGPCADIGWDGDWGMAASSADKDYVHQLYAKLTASGQKVYMRIKQCSFWEGNFTSDDVLKAYEKEREFDADVVIFKLGENVKDKNKPYFKDALKKFIDYICVNGKVVFVTCFWKNEIVDDVIKEVALERNDVCVDGYLSYDDKNMAFGKFWHRGVELHPSDDGMKAIAERIFEVL